MTGPAVVLAVSAVPEHVRTARLVSLAVARRCGLDDTVVEEVRLAVGEACTRLVGSAPAGHRLELALDDAPGRLEAVVRLVPAVPADDAQPPEDEVSRRLLEGLTTTAEVEPHRVRMTWTAP